MQKSADLHLEYF